MTGPVMLLRQQSSTVGNPITNKDHPQKLRRCSSADDSTSLELVSDDRYSKSQFSAFQSTPDYTLSESDSGTEDFDQQNFSRWKPTTSADNVDDEQASTITSFGAATDDEGFSEHETVVVESEGAEQISRIVQDLELAATISDVEKKDFCENTRVAFHGEFARNIQIPIALQYPGVRWTMITEDDLDHILGGPIPPSAFIVRKVDNAKAQFKCPNKQCQHAWTSMRARISFLISTPEYGLVVMKVYTQACQYCQTPADPLWYIDEVCRVMKNLRGDFNNIYPLKDVDFGEQQQQSMMQWSENYFRRSRHDPTQRRGKMHAMHDSRLCEACQHGVCFC